MKHLFSLWLLVADKKKRLKTTTKKKDKVPSKLTKIASELTNCAIILLSCTLQFQIFIFVFAEKSLTPGMYLVCTDPSAPQFCSVLCTACYPTGSVSEVHAVYSEQALHLLN